MFTLEVLAASYMHNHEANQALPQFSSTTLYINRHTWILIVPWYSGACGISREAGGDEPQVPTAPDHRRSRGTLLLTSTSKTRANDGRSPYTAHPIN